MASLKAIQDSFAHSGGLHPMPGAGIAAVSTVAPLIVPSEDEIDAHAKAAAEEWMRTHDEGAESGADHAVEETAAEAASEHALAVASDDPEEAAAETAADETGPPAEDSATEPEEASEVTVPDEATEAATAAAEEGSPTTADAEDASDDVPFPKNGGAYRFINLDSHRTMNAYAVDGHSWASGMGAGAPHETISTGEDLWITTLQEGGGYRIVNSVSNRALFAQDFVSSWTAGVGAAPAGSPHYADQVWDFVSDAEDTGRYMIVNRHSGRALFAQRPDNHGGFGAGPSGSGPYNDNWWSATAIHEA